MAKNVYNSVRKYLTELDSFATLDIVSMKGNTMTFINNLCTECNKTELFCFCDSETSYEAIMCPTNQQVTEAEA